MPCFNPTNNQEDSIHDSPKDLDDLKVDEKAWE